MGLPASGKSTIAKRLYEKKYKIIDCDEIKKEHKDYDPKNPQTVHSWSSQELEKRFQEALLKDESIVIDGTGSNSDKLVRRINEAKEKGFRTRVVYITCNLATSLKRNSARERVVPESIIMEKYKDIRYSFEIVSPNADEVKVINNN